MQGESKGGRAAIDADVRACIEGRPCVQLEQLERGWSIEPDHARVNGHASRRVGERREALAAAAIDDRSEAGRGG